MIDSLQPGLRKSTSRAKPGIVVQCNRFRLNPSYKEKHPIPPHKSKIILQFFIPQFPGNSYKSQIFNRFHVTDQSLAALLDRFRFDHALTPGNQVLPKRH